MVEFLTQVRLLLGDYLALGLYCGARGYQTAGIVTGLGVSSAPVGEMKVRNNLQS